MVCEIHDLISDIQGCSFNFWGVFGIFHSIAAVLFRLLETSKEKKDGRNDQPYDFCPAFETAA